MEPRLHTEVRADSVRGEMGANVENTVTSHIIWDWYRIIEILIQLGECAFKFRCRRPILKAERNEIRIT
jgi:hypothetical protein